MGKKQEVDPVREEETTPEMAKYTYKSVVPGCWITIEVSRAWVEILQKEDAVERNRNRAETRRHESFDSETYYKGKSEDNVDRCFRRLCMQEQLETATIGLTPKQRSIIDAIYRRGLTLTECAKENGVAVSTVYRLHTAALRNLRRTHLA